MAKFHYWTRAITGNGPSMSVGNLLTQGPSVAATRSFSDTLVRVRWHMFWVVAVQGSAPVPTPLFWSQTQLTTGLWFNDQGVNVTPDPAALPSDPGWVALESIPWQAQSIDPAGLNYTINYRASIDVIESFGQRKGRGITYPRIRGAYRMGDPTLTIGTNVGGTQVFLGWRSTLAALWASDQPS